MLKKEKNLWQNYSYIFISFFAAAVTMLIIYLCNGVVPFGDKTVLRMDLYHQYGPLFAELYERVKNGDSLIYSWTSGLGSCFIGNFFNYLSSPLSAIIFFFSHKNIPVAIGVMVLIKSALSSASFTYYVKKSLNKQSLATCAFSVLYAFCGYMLAYYWNIMWLDAMFLLPILVYGIERIINHGKMRTYVTVLALSMFSNYYISFMLCIFSVIYFFYYFFSNYSTDSKVSLRFAQNKKGFFASLSNNRFVRTAFIFGIGSLTAAGIMAVVLIPVYKILTDCSATANPFPKELTSYFSYFDFFANHLANLTTTIRSSGDDVLPNVYCGVLTLILAPLYFFSKTITKKEKVATLSLLTVLYFSFSLNIPNYLWHAFHFPNDLPYRQSFIYSFVLLVIAYKVFIRLGEFSTKVIGGVGAGLFAFIILVDEITSKNVTTGTVLLSFLLIVIFVIVLSVFKDKRYKAASVAALLLVCCCSEAVMCDTSTMEISVDKTPYVSDYDSFTVIKDSLDEAEQDNFYRMELSNLRTRMDPSWYYYNGASVFSSMAFEKLANLQYNLGMMSNEINSYTYNPQTPVYNMMFAMKYIVNNSTPDVHKASPYFTQVSSYDKYTAYQNKYYLPLAYCASSGLEQWESKQYHTDWETSGENPFELQGDFFDLATGGLGTPFIQIPVDGISYSNLEPFFDTTSYSQFYDKRSDELDASATYRIVAPSDGNIYVYFEATGRENKEATINTPSGVITQAMTQNCIFDLGYLKKGQIVTVNIPVEANTGTVKFCAYGIDNDILEKGYKLLSKHSVSIDTFEETLIKGTFTAPKDCLVYTSIPYNDGWDVYIDGKKADEKDIVRLADALLAVKVKKGEHSIEFSYSVPGFKGGLVITLFTLFIMLAVILFNLALKRKKKKLRALAAFPQENDFFSESIFLPVKKKSPPVEVIESVSLNLIDHTSKEKAPVREIITPPEKGIVREVFSPENK